MTGMPALGGQSVFLSASFPSGERAERFPAADPAAIAAYRAAGDSQVAVVRNATSVSCRVVADCGADQH